MLAPRPQPAPQAPAGALAVTRVREQLAALRQALEALTEAILAVTIEGQIQWATPRARTLLETYGLVHPHRKSRLSQVLRDWLFQQDAAFDRAESRPAPGAPLTIEHRAGRLRVRLVRTDAQRLLFLEEQNSEFTTTALAPLGLSRRETEILGWVAQGKSNPEIGIILGISRRTVQKHLERAYGWLRVENRHAAIALALETARAQR